MSKDFGDNIPKDLAGSPEEPEIRFGEFWVPAHQAWKKLEIASTVTDNIDHFNARFPQLSTELTRSVVPLVRQRLKNVDMRTPRRKAGEDLAPLAKELLQSMLPEDVLNTLARDHDEKLNLRELIALAGEHAYLQSLRTEAGEYESNKISPDQTAQIWNEMLRPAPGGGLWTREKVHRLINGLYIHAED